MENTNDGGLPPHDDAGDPETWGMWEAGLLLGSVAVGVTGLAVLGWAVERFILS